MGVTGETESVYRDVRLHYLISVHVAVIHCFPWVGIFNVIGHLNCTQQQIPEIILLLACMMILTTS